MSWLSIKKKEDFFLVLDIGTRAVKSLFCFSQEGKLFILSKAVKNFSEYESGNIPLVESARSAVSDCFKSGVKNISFSTADRKIKNIASNLKKWKTVMTFSPDVFRVRIISQGISRKINSGKISSNEEKKMLGVIIESGKKEAMKDFSSKSGIQARDVLFISSEIFDFKIDGYPVKELKGYGGREIEAKILLAFIPVSYHRALMEIANVLKKETKVVSIIHLAESLLDFQGIKNGLFIDIGGKSTQCFISSSSQLSGYFEFDSGAVVFSEALSSDLGIGIDLAENMQEMYSNKLLSGQSLMKVKSIFSIPKNNWYNELIKELEKKKSVSPSCIYLMGGGASLPEIQDAFKEKGQNTSVLTGNLKNIEDTSKNINKPQWTPAVLIANKYAQKNI